MRSIPLSDLVSTILLENVSTSIASMETISKLFDNTNAKKNYLLFGRGHKDLYLIKQREDKIRVNF